MATKEAPTLPFKIVNSSRTERWLNILVYGDWGVGKTHLASTAQDINEMQHVLFISAESGDLTLSGRDDIDVIQINKYSQLARIYEYLKVHIQARDDGDDARLLELERRFKGDDTIKVPKKYRTVVIDSLTEVSKYCLYQLVGVNIGGTTLDIEPDSPEYSEWNKLTEMIRLLVRSFRDLNIHFVVVCSQKATENERKQQIMGLNLTAALAKEVPGFLDVVGYLAQGNTEDGKTVRRLFLEPGRNFLAKHRFGQTLEKPFLENPTLSDVLSLLPKNTKK